MFEAIEKKYDKTSEKILGMSFNETWNEIVRVRKATNGGNAKNLDSLQRATTT
jgi:hypothetical protein